MERRILSARKTTAESVLGAAKKIVTSKKIIAVLMICLLVSTSMFADGVADVNNSVQNKIQLVIQFIYSPWVKFLICAVFAAKAVSFILNHEQGTFKKLIPLGGAVLIYFAAPKVAAALIDNTSANEAITAIGGTIKN